MALYATNIEWETDGEAVNLPNRVEIPSAINKEDIMDFLSDQFGWLIKGYNLERT